MNKLGIKIFILSILSILVIGTIPASRVYSQSSSDIQKEIDEQRKQLEETQKQIAQLEGNISETQKNIDAAGQGIPKLQAEIEKIQYQMDLNKKQLELYNQQNELLKLEKQRLELQQKESIVDAYKKWRLENQQFNTIKGDANVEYRNSQYTSRVLKIGNNEVEQTALELEKLNQTIDGLNTILADLDSKSAELIKEKNRIQAEIDYYNSILASNVSDLSGLKDLQGSIENQISNLRQEQQEAARRESEIIKVDPPPVTNPPPVVENGFFFTGRGRDLYQGHGVGMSQWGAYGAGFAGMTAEQILKFYYADTKVEARPGTINVQGYGTMDINKYAAGLGEVPSKACGNAAQAAARPDKYVVDNTGTPWDCWPEETIKAQVIAAKSYALTYGGTICTTAACQVYEGHTQKQWAADETKDLVVVSTGYTSNGQIIQALYSSDNSQGSGTANNDTVFQTFGGDGTPYSYLRAVNDTSFAATSSWTYWTYQTQSYNLGSIKEMLQYVATGAIGSYEASNASAMLSGVQNFTAINFERDPSGRVKKVFLTAQDGSIRTIGGWWFKNLWNSWMYDIGRYDYIYSLTFFKN